MQFSSSSWKKKSVSIYTVGRKLGDGEMYVVALDDMATAGILVRAYKQATSERYTLSVSEGELATARLSRSDEDLGRLAESIDVYCIDGQMFIHSRIEGISKPKIVLTGDKAKGYLQRLKAGNGSLEHLLTTALSELCKVKPEGLNAVRWLGQWLLANNPNKPSVGEVDEQEEGDKERQKHHDTFFK